MQYKTPLRPMHFKQTSVDEPGDGLVEHHLCTELGTAWSTAWCTAALSGGLGRAWPASFLPRWMCSKSNVSTLVIKCWLNSHSHMSLIFQKSLGIEERGQERWGQRSRKVGVMARRRAPGPCPVWCPRYPSAQTRGAWAEPAATSSVTSELEKGKYMA